MNPGVIPTRRDRAASPRQQLVWREETLYTETSRRRSVHYTSRTIRHPWLLVWVGLALPCQGCAFNYADENGDRHVIGLVDITVHPSAAPQTFAGDVLEITSIGLSVGQTAQGSYLTAGYNREVTAALRDNALV